MFTTIRYFLLFTCTLHTFAATVLINTTISLHPLRANFASLGWEPIWALALLPNLSDPRLIRAASALSPATLRLGGISAQWMQYTGAGGPLPPPQAPFGEGCVEQGWPPQQENFTLSQLRNITLFAAAANLTLMLDLNELYGRTCNSSSGRWTGCFCTGSLDTSNARALLEALRDEGLAGGAATGAPLRFFELGNEMISHIGAATNVADVRAVAAVLQSVFNMTPPAERPQLYAPGTDFCTSADQLQIMENITGVQGVAGFSFHAYPAGSGQGGNALAKLLLDPTWLRRGLMGPGTHAGDCLGAWDAQGGPRARGLDLWVSETSSSFNILPAPAQNSFLHGMFTLAALGQFAATGVGVVATWAFSEPTTFAKLAPSADGARWEAAPDYFLLVAHKRAVGDAVLAVDDGGSGSPLVFGACGVAGNGSVAVLAVNPANVSVPLTFAASSNGTRIPSTPRLEYVFTTVGDILSSNASRLNGGPPLQLMNDGGLPDDLAPAFVPAGGADAQLPPFSQAIFVLLDAGAAACLK